jgi:hypothetical protein
MLKYAPMVPVWNSRIKKMQSPASELRLALNLIDIGDGQKAIEDDKRSW